MNTWILRVLWVSLPVTAGDALADWMRSWSDEPRLVTTALLWILWAVVLSALRVPRPVASTLARLGTPLAVVAVVLAAASGKASTGSWVLALVATGVAWVLAVRGEFARLCAQGAAYGDEERFPLTVPPGISFVMLPVAIAVVGAGIAAGPLLLADRQWLAG